MTRNVVVLCLDTVRKDYFDDFAPKLSAAADVSFAQCRAASSWSPPSHASMLTGQLPHQHGVHAFCPEFDALSREDTLFGDLPNHEAVGVSANVYASSGFGFDTLFDTFEEVSPKRRFSGGMDVETFGQENSHEGVRKYAAYLRAALGHDHPLQSVLNGAFATLDDLAGSLPVAKPFDDGATAVLRRARRQVERRSGPFVQFVNVMEAHAPHTPIRGYDDSVYDVPTTWTSHDFDSFEINVHGETKAHEDDLGRFRDLYSAAIDYLDRHVAAYVEWLLAETDRETTVLVTADHGENLGLPSDDGGMVAHSASCSEGLLHVPLAVVNPPAGYPARVEEFVSHLALRRLVVGLATGETPDISAGPKEMVAERIGSNATSDRLTDAEATRISRTIRCAYDGDRKFEWDTTGYTARHELSWDRPNWQKTVEESVDVTPYEGRFGTPIEAVGVRACNASDADVDEGTRNRLEDLGYL